MRMVMVVRMMTVVRVRAAHSGFLRPLRRGRYTIRVTIKAKVRMMVGGKDEGCPFRSSKRQISCEALSWATRYRLSANTTFSIWSVRNSYMST